MNLAGGGCGGGEVNLVGGGQSCGGGGLNLVGGVGGGLNLVGGGGRGFTTVGGGQGTDGGKAGKIVETLSIALFFLIFELFAPIFKLTLSPTSKSSKSLLST